MAKIRTGDRATFYTTEQLGPRRSRTPEGFLILHDVPIARTGEMVYGPGETPVEAGPEGVVIITRTDEEVFNPRTIASAQGKPYTIEHPPVDVDPSNWNDLARGVVFDPRRGEGAQADLLIADIMVTNRDAIADIEAGKVEVSAGYDANYFQLQPGRGEQRDIIFNHVAGVDRGRCGPRCSIGDRERLIDADETEDLMGSTLAKAMQKLREQLGVDTTKFDEACLKVGLSAVRDEEMGSGGHAVVIHNHGSGGGEKERTDDEDDPTEKRFKKIEDAVGGLAKDMKRVADAVAKIGDKRGRDDDDDDETEEEKKKRLERERGEDRRRGKDDLEDLPNDVNAANKRILGQLELEVPPGAKVTDAAVRDSAILAPSFNDTVATAEIICPGIRVPTYDRAAPATKTFDAICGLRRDALQLAFNGNPALRGLIGDSFAVGSGQLDTRDKCWTCDTIRTVFRTVGAYAARLNNAAPFSGGSLAARAGAQDGKGPPKSLAELNTRNAEYWSKKSA